LGKFEEDNQKLLLAVKKLQNDNRENNRRLAKLVPAFNQLLAENR
jgi:hypothetical protein